MKNLFSSFFSSLSSKNGGIVWRLGIFVVLAVFVVLLFPRYNNTFRYHFEVGKPWGYAKLTADFDFPIYKTDEQMASEQAKLLSTFMPTYRYIKGTQRQVLVMPLSELEWAESENYGRVSVLQGRVALSLIHI